MDRPTPRLRRAALVALGASALLAMGQAGTTPARVDVVPVVESEAVHPGATLRLALQISIANGFHIQSNQPLDPSLVPAELTLTPPPGVTASGPIFPASVEFKLDGSDAPSAVFDGTILVGVVATIAPDHAPGPVTVPARFRYQACNQTMCFMPIAIQTEWTFRVVPAGQPVERQHAEIFQKIDFSRQPTAPAAAAPESAPTAGPTAAASGGDPLQQFDQFHIAGAAGGYMGPSAFLQFIHDAETGVTSRGPFEGRGPLAILLLVFVGGLALNLTPCVLPMIPINLAIIGAGAQQSRRSRGFWLGATYGGAMALVYGVLGLVVILSTGTFGTINASPWFNVGIAVLFVILGLAMFDVLSLDFSGWSSRIRFSQASRGTFVLAFSMGAVAALLAGACVAPVVIQVIVFASNLYRRARRPPWRCPSASAWGWRCPGRLPAPAWHRCRNPERGWSASNRCSASSSSPRPSITATSRTASSRAAGSIRRASRRASSSSSKPAGTARSRPASRPRSRTTRRCCSTSGRPGARTV